jgi:hypothetical protein
MISVHSYEVRPRKEKRGVDLISDALPFGALWYAGPNAVANAIGYAQHFSCSRDAIIRVYRTCLLLIFCQSHILSRPACGVGVCLARFYIQLYFRRLGIV